MSQPSALSPAQQAATRLRVQLLAAFDSLERAAADLRTGLAIRHEADRATAADQLVAAQELIRGVGLRLREDAGLPELPPAKVCAGCGALPPERGDAYCAGCRSALDRGSNPADWAPAS